MPSVHAVIPIMEGMVATMPSNGKQDVATFVELCKAVMRQPTLRDATNWNFVASDDPDESANNILNGAGTLYGVLIAQADDQANFVCINDNTSNTYDGTAALDNEDLLVINVPAAATTGTEDFYSWVSPQGQAYATGITIGADGLDGTNPGTGDLRAWLLYRG